MFTKKNRTLALLICVTFFIVTLFSVLFVVAEADHDCIGEDCPVCACIHHAEQTLKQLGMGIGSAAGWMPVAVTLIFCIPCVLCAGAHQTPIGQKVRLNN